jgi:TRAP-type C4-dicarboxylate transport system permease large subunit
LVDRSKNNKRDMPMAYARKLIQRFFSLTVLTLLLATVVAGTSENMNAQMLKLGIHIWDDYFILRGEEPKSSCNPNPVIDEQLDLLQTEFDQENADFDLLADEFDRDSARTSLVKQLRVCAKKHDNAAIYHENNSVWVQLFSSFEDSFAQISLFSIAHQKTILIVLLMVSALFATWRQEHIAFRTVKSKLDHYVSHTAQLVATGCLSISAYSFYDGAISAGTTLSSPQLMIILMIGSGLLAIVSAYQLLLKSKQLLPGGNVLHALLTVPIHTWMLLLAANHFFVHEVHLPGTAMYFTQIFQLTNLHLSIGLYIWVGMLLKETLLGSKLFDVFKPWNFPPEILAFVAILIMAVPTAYTGASGIIIIAMGAVVYQELRRVGTRRQLALAVTAMTGSSGVVLRPCLLVVGIAILNKEVVTDQLFHWGFRVFMLTLVVFFFYAMLTRRDPLKISPFNEAIGPSLQRLKPLFPYLMILLTAMTFYAVFLNAYLDEFSAPTILPVIIMGFIIYERRFSKDFSERNATAGASPNVTRAFSTSINNSSVQIGALLMLMACSFTIGGIIERTGGSSFSVPESFDSIFLAMAFLVFCLFLIGMVMDPFGALVLVSFIIAPVAYSQGIEPIHFWMTCLVAFELGYLSPPVSLNHLLTRQVVGDEEVTLALQEGDSFYYRHERMLLPLLVMFTTLLIVAFGPLLYKLL